MKVVIFVLSYLLTFLLASVIFSLLVKREIGIDKLDIENYGTIKKIVCFVILVSSPFLAILSMIFPSFLAQSIISLEYLKIILWLLVSVYSFVIAFLFSNN